MNEPKPTVGPRFGDPRSKNWIYKSGVGWTWVEPKDEETLAEKLETKLGHANKPTEAIIQDAMNANFAVASRLEHDLGVDYLNRQGWTGNGVLRSNPEQYRDNLMEYQQSVERAIRATARMLMWIKRKELKR